MEPRRFSKEVREGTPGNSLGGAELARGGGFSCKKGEKNQISEAFMENLS